MLMTETNETRSETFFSLVSIFTNKKISIKRKKNHTRIERLNIIHRAILWNAKCWSTAEGAIIKIKLCAFMWTNEWTKWKKNERKYRERQAKNSSLIGFALCLKNFRHFQVNALDFGVCLNFHSNGIWNFCHTCRHIHTHYAGEFRHRYEGKMRLNDNEKNTWNCMQENMRCAKKNWNRILMAEGKNTHWLTQSHCLVGLMSTNCRATNERERKRPKWKKKSNRLSTDDFFRRFGVSKKRNVSQVHAWICARRTAHQRQSNFIFLFVFSFSVVCLLLHSCQLLVACDFFSLSFWLSLFLYVLDFFCSFCHFSILGVCII